MHTLKKIMLGNIPLEVNLVRSKSNELKMLVVNVLVSRFVVNKRHITFHIPEKVVQMTKQVHSKKDSDNKRCFVVSFENKNYLVSGWNILPNNISRDGLDGFDDVFACPQPYVSFRFWIVPPKSAISTQEKFQPLPHQPKPGHVHENYTLFYKDIFNLHDFDIGVEVINSCCPSYLRPKVNLKIRSFEGITQELAILNKDGKMEIHNNMIPRSLWEDGE